MGIMRVSSSFNFEKKIMSFCQLPRYEIDEMGEEIAFIIAHPPESEAIDTHFLVLHNLPNTVRFDMSSMIMVSDSDEVPHKLSTMLLNLNSSNMLGFWCLVATDDQFVFTYSHYVPKISLNKKLFDEIVDSMLANCSQLYQIIESSSSAADTDQDSQPQSKHPHEHS